MGQLTCGGKAASNRLRRVDNMETVFPEGLRLILKNIYSAAMLKGFFIFRSKWRQIVRLKKSSSQPSKNNPVVYGELADENGYHYYPRLEQGREWLAQVNFQIIDETFGDLYSTFSST